MDAITQPESIPSQYWANVFGVEAGALFSQPCNVIQHSPRLAEHRGIQGIYRGKSGTLSFPLDCCQSLRDLSSKCGDGVEQIADAYRSTGLEVIGPAYIGYADRVQKTASDARLLTIDDLELLNELKSHCLVAEWDHGGSEIGETPLAGFMVQRELIAVAGYEVWGGVIAHISVVVHPAHRGKGYGRSVVSLCASTAIAAGLLAQYRTLGANIPSIQIANSLGFESFAESVAIRLRPEDLTPPSP